MATTAQIYEILNSINAWDKFPRADMTGAQYQKQ